MTDSPTPADPGPVDPDVDLASAHLDGEAGPDERERVQEQAVAVHLAAFEAIADQVRDVPPVPAGLLDDQVARALASFDEGATVAPIGRDRVEAPWWQRIPLGAVAAALVVVALIGALSLAVGGADDDDVATSALDVAADEGDSGAGTGGGSEESFSTGMDDGAPLADSAPMESGATSGAAGATPARQVFADYEELAVGLRAELSGDPTLEAAPGEEGSGTPERGTEAEVGAADGSDPCGAVALLGLDPAGVVLVRPAVVGPDPVTAVVHDAEDGRRLVVVDDASCTVVLDRAL